MSRVSPTPALARLRGEFPPAGRPRLLAHRGTCGDAVGMGDVVGALRAAMPGAPIVEAACDGACWAAPAATVQREGHSHRFARLDRGIPEELGACLDGRCDEEYAGRGEYGVTERMGRSDGTFGDALARGAYGAAAWAASLRPEQVIDAVGRAGTTEHRGTSATTTTGATAGEPSLAQRWRQVATHEGQKYLVVDAGQGEPGVFTDRHLLEGDPHRLVDGILVACRATGVDSVFVYVGGHAREARITLERALVQAREHAILDGSALGGAPVTIEVRSGAGRQVSDTGSVVLNAIEGGRPVPRERTSSLTEHGLWQRPTLIHGVETLCAVTTAFDTPPPPTRLIALSGAVPRPGLYEVPIDGNTTWAGVLAMAGVMPGLVPAVLLGSAPGRFVTPEEYEEPLTARGLGTGGAVVLPRGADVTEVAEAFGR